MDKMIAGENFDSVIDAFEDEVDCTIIDDKDMERALAGDNGIDEDIIDTSIDYSDDIHDPDMVDTDADDYIAAERDVMNDPFEEDDIMDAVSNDSDIYVDEDD